MTLTKAEAENILSRVFEKELGGNKVMIDVADGSSINLGNPLSGILLSRSSFSRVMQLLASESRFKIDAIKLYREGVPGTGLAEAKNFVESLQANTTP
jgi:ribosomal protein L7/L12